MRYPRRCPIASFIMGFEDEVEQFMRRPCRPCDGRSEQLIPYNDVLVISAVGQRVTRYSVFEWLSSCVLLRDVAVGIIGH